MGKIIDVIPVVGTFILLVSFFYGPHAGPRAGKGWCDPLPITHRGKPLDPQRAELATSQLRCIWPDYRAALIRIILFIIVLGQWVLLGKGFASFPLREVFLFLDSFVTLMLGRSIVLYTM